MDGEATVSDELTHRLIGIKEMLIAAGVEAGKINEAEFTPLGQQAGGWYAELTRIIREIKFHIEAREEVAAVGASTGMEKQP